MKYIVAVSGGVDSVVLLDILVKSAEHELVVAHFDHGIRPESGDDARFVAGLADNYRLPFETKREELGSRASEELARSRRYNFLKSVAKKHGGKIATAHHSNDIVETIAINLTRGTGWRGLAVLDSADIERPLFEKTKTEVYEYALANRLEWVEDATNQSDDYLRNRMRKKTIQLSPDMQKKIFTLWQAQCALKKDIDQEASNILTSHNINSRYFFTMIENNIALELLRSLLVQLGTSLTRPQRHRLLLAIKTALPGKRIEVGEQVEATFTKREFIVKVTL